MAHDQFPCRVRTMKILAMLRSFGFACGLPLASLMLSGCVLLDLKQNDVSQQKHGVVAVQVSGAPQGAPAYALALKDGVVVTAREVPANGLAAFLLPAGETFDIAVFSDLNHNHRFDVAEPAALLASVRPMALSDASYRGSVMPASLRRSGSGVPSGLVMPTAPRKGVDPTAMDIHLGEIVSLSDPRFSAANGSLGFWQPYEFLTELGWGVYFLQPYDSAKIPVLFVYGIDGSPQDWKSMIASLDRSKYQPWFFHYPSGIRLEKSANGLSRALQMLKTRYGFSRMYVVAHSMGGLVSRGGIEQAIQESGTNFIPKFITLCTPWGGDAEADGGVQHLKYPVPAWIDMQPGSPYLKQIFARKLPANTRHWLIFDFQTHSAPWLKPDNDGVVQVRSELFPAAQADAVKMFGFNYGHVETLGKRDVHAKVNEFLLQP